MTDNILVGPGDFDEFCITAPSDPKLPGGGGYPVCGLYNLKQNKFGQTSEHRQGDGRVRRVQEHERLLQRAVDARLAHDIRLGGGFDTGRSVRDRCFVVDSPQEMYQCSVVTPFGAQTQFKRTVCSRCRAVRRELRRVRTCPVRCSPPATRRRTPRCDWVGRIDLCRRRDIGDNIQLVDPQTLFEDRISRLDLRLSKVFRINKVRIQLNLDAYNALNSSAIRADNTSYGSAWTSTRFRFWMPESSNSAGRSASKNVQGTAELGQLQERHLDEDAFAQLPQLPRIPVPRYSLHLTSIFPNKRASAGAGARFGP